MKRDERMTYGSAYLTTDEAAELLRVHPRSLWNWRREGRLPSLRLAGRGVRFRREHVLALLGPEPRAMMPALPR
jgi:excisionase family DNA binding protein